MSYFMGRFMAGQSESTIKKTALRAEFRARRQAQDEGVCRQRSAAICQKLGEISPIQAAAHLGVYAAARNEADLTAYLRARLASDVALYFPRVAAERTLDFVRVKRLDTLVSGAFGILEPVGSPVEPAQIEVFLIPGVAFDRQGNRVGFGGGYYDRALEKIKNSAILPGASAPLLVGVCYQWQLVDGKIPVESYDMTMDMLVTEEQVYHCAGPPNIPPGASR